MTAETIATPDKLIVDGITFIPAQDAPITEWPCVISERPQPTLTIKDDDIFLVTDTLGNISGCLMDDRTASMGLFCNDTRFLSRLELQIEGRSPVLLSSTAEKGFLLSILCTNPHIEDRLKPDTLGIRREIAVSGALFEEIEVSNYSTIPISFEISISFNSDFVDLFEIRGTHREKQGKLLREVAPNTEEDTPRHPKALRLAYQGLDKSLMQSVIEFQHRTPDEFKGYTALWQIELGSHETQKLGYRLQMLLNNSSASTITNAPATLRQAKAAEYSEEQHWGEQITQIRSDKATFNRVIDRAEQDLYLLRQTFGKHKTVAAGVPWYSTLFGRDSLITASQTLMLNPQIAKETLTLLALYQGKVEDEWREEEPGKILH